jgi:hypothetical protein
MKFIKSVNNNGFVQWINVAFIQTAWSVDLPPHINSAIGTAREENIYYFHETLDELMKLIDDA